METKAQWQRLCAAIARPELAEDARFRSLSARLRHREVLDGLIAEWTRDRDASEVMRRLQAAAFALAEAWFGCALSLAAARESSPATGEAEESAGAAMSAAARARWDPKRRMVFLMMRRGAGER